jgi:hypothetical protein
MEVYTLKVCFRLYNNSVAIYLTNQTNHLGVTSLTQYHKLSIEALHLLISSLNTSLQCCHNGAGGVDNLYTALSCKGVCCRGFAMCADKHAAISIKVFNVAVADSLKTQSLKALHLNAIMDNITQTAHPTVLREGTFSL